MVNYCATYTLIVHHLIKFLRYVFPYRRQLDPHGNVSVQQDGHIVFVRRAVHLHGRNLSHQSAAKLTLHVLHDRSAGFDRRTTNATACQGVETAADDAVRVDCATVSLYHFRISRNGQCSATEHGQRGGES